jgi:hypothetical protein
MIASPMYFSTVPSWRSSTARISAKYAPRTSRTDSLSRRSPRAVEPARSENTIVTVLRSSSGGGAGASAAPHTPHSRNRSGFSSPQLGQICTSRV